MSMKPLNKHVALAIDGGGIKGLIVARALMALEDELGGGPLINHPEIKILAGTSTGAIITAAIAMGMRAEDIAKIYRDMGQTVFPPVVPAWFPRFTVQVAELLRVMWQTYVHSNKALIEELKKTIENHTGDADLTLADLNRRLGPDKGLILTAVDINERRTRFLKSYKDDNGGWKLWEAILASSSSPMALPIWPRVESTGKRVYYTDGGVGSFGNPAYIAAQEAIVFHDYAPQEVSILSFGTGWVNSDNFERANKVPTSWRVVGWAKNAPMLLVGDVARAQSLDIIERFGGQGIDFRRFQFELENDISSDAFADDETYNFMVELGNQLGERIRCNQFAPSEVAQYDPEGLYHRQKKLQDAMEAGKAHRTK